jgi:hypothetical protein
MAIFELWLTDNTGETRLALLDTFLEFEYARVQNDVGAWWVELPANFDEDLITVDGRVEFWRGWEAGKLALDFVGFIRRLRFEMDKDGQETITISGPDANDVLDRRIVAYAAGTSQALKTDEADDMISSIFRQNMGDTATDTDRDMTAFGFTREGFNSAAPSITKAFAWRNALKTMQDIAVASATQVYFGLEPLSASEFEFRTRVGQWGQDRSDNTSSAFLQFGPEWGNVENASLEYDYTEEVTYVYAGGQGEQSEREIVEMEAATRAARSPINRREAFADARSDAETAGVTAAARSRLADGRPRLRFRADLLDSEQARYQRDWHFGDKVAVTFHGRQFAGPILAVKVGMDQDGQESIRARLEVEE